MAIQVVILAAGQGKRMHSNKPKVLHKLAGKSMLEHVIATAEKVAPETTPIIIYGHQGEALRNALTHVNARWIEQAEQLGTGHALLQALPEIAENDQVLILYGDVPLISTDTLTKFINDIPKNDLGILTTQLSDPTGYGRIKRNEQNEIFKIVEQKDATTEEHKITEVNTGIYLIPKKYLSNWLPKLENKNAQGEYYLTDVIAMAVKEKIPVLAAQPLRFEEILGVNDRLQLAHLERFYQRQYAENLMRQGVTLHDPNRLDVRGEIQVGRDVVIDINVILEGRVVIGDGCMIGPNVVLRNVELGHGVEIKANSVLDDAVISDECVIGPFARIRPGTVLAKQVHVGNFVEIKNSRLGEKTKINHLSYAGDSQIGKEVNIGAGTITCNYDGFKKHTTIIGDRVQVGSDTTLIAPVTIHDDAYIATATTVRKDVPAGALVFNVREEKIRDGWVEAYREKNKK